MRCGLVAFFVSNEVVRKTNGDDDCATIKSKNRWLRLGLRRRVCWKETRASTLTNRQKKIQIVIPAKAGIHPQYEARISAFAGMTMGLSERSRVMQVAFDFARYPIQAWTDSKRASSCALKLMLLITFTTSRQPHLRAMPATRRTAQAERW